MIDNLKLDAIAESIHYNKNFLGQEGTSDQFFKEIAYGVKLDGK